MVHRNTDLELQNILKYVTFVDTGGSFLGESTVVYYFTGGSFLLCLLGIVLFQFVSNDEPGDILLILFHLTGFGQNVILFLLSLVKDNSTMRRQYLYSSYFTQVITMFVDWLYVLYLIVFFMIFGQRY